MLLTAMARSTEFATLLTATLRACDMRPATELKRAVVTMSTTAFAQLIMQRLRNGGLSLRWCLLRSAPSLRGCAFQIVSGDNQGVDVNRHRGFHLTMAISDTSQNEILKCRSAQRRLWGRERAGVRRGKGVVRGSRTVGRWDASGRPASKVWPEGEGAGGGRSEPCRVRVRHGQS